MSAQDHIREGRITQQWFGEHVVSYMWLGRRNELMINFAHTDDYPMLSHA